MATKAHKLLTGTDLHEPKGVASVPAGQVYVSDGAGSGVWTTITTDVGFSTGDVKFTYKTTADTGWLMLDDTTIGSATSPASKKSATYQALFLLLWTSINAAYTTVSGGRGGSAAADWAANKSITLPKILGRAFFAAGAGSGLTARNLGQTGVGAETVTLGTLNLPAYTPSGTIAVNFNIGATAPVQGAYPGVTLGGVAAVGTNAGTATTIPITFAGNVTAGFSGDTQGGVSLPFNTISPATFVNVMVKI